MSKLSDFLDITASELLTKIKTVDGAGSGLDADLFDSLDSSQFIRSDIDDSMSGSLINTNNSNVSGPNFDVQTTNKSTTEYAYKVTRNGAGVAGFLVDGDFLAKTGEFTDYIQAKGFVSDETDMIRVMFPGGASVKTSSSSTTGAIKITLPVTWNSAMLMFNVNIFNYTTNETFTIKCGGYLYSGGSSWVNTSAYILANPGVNLDYTIRFGHDGTCCVYIGELTDTWDYVQVSVTDFECGYASTTNDDWNDGWDISFESSAFSNVTKTNSTNQIGKTLDGLSSSQFLRSDVNDTQTATLTLNVVEVGNEIRFPTSTSTTDVTICHTSDQDTGFNFDGSGGVNFISNGTLLYNLTNVWHSGNDGSGSGLDADTVDGLNAASFLRSDAADTHSGTITPSTDNTIDLGSSSLKYATVYATTFEGTATSAKYADLAEKYTIKDEVECGHVILIGSEDFDCEKSNEIGSQRVLGVVSTNPAFKMNAELENGKYVALKGRVPCGVYGECKKGDPLISFESGLAISINHLLVDEKLKSTPGIIFAKALEDSHTEMCETIEIVVL